MTVLTAWSDRGLFLCGLCVVTAWYVGGPDLCGLWGPHPERVGPRKTTQGVLRGLEKVEELDHATQTTQRVGS
jgi:hypothetical protein